MLQTKLVATGVQDAYHIEYVPVNFTGHDDYMVGTWDPGQPDRLTIGSGEDSLYYLIGNIEWQEDMSNVFSRTAIYQYDSSGNQKAWLDGVYYDTRLHTWQRIVGPSGSGDWRIPLKEPWLTQLMPSGTNGCYMFGEIDAQPGDYITLVGEHAGYDNRHMAGNIFLLLTQL